MTEKENPTHFGKSLQCWNCGCYDEYAHRCLKFDRYITKPIEHVCSAHKRFHGMRHRASPDANRTQTSHKGMTF